MKLANNFDQFWGVNKCPNEAKPILNKRTTSQQSKIERRTDKNKSNRKKEQKQIEEGVRKRGNGGQEAQTQIFFCRVCLFL